MSKRHLEVPNEVHHLSDLIGQFIQYWGFKRIHGQIWTHIWLAKNPVDATTLVKRLNVSKALVSLAIKDLLKYDVVQVVSQSDRRKMLLVPNLDIHGVIVTILKNRESKMMAEIVKSQNSIDKLKQSSKESMDLDQDRLEQMQLISSMAEVALQTLISNNLKM